MSIQVLNKVFVTNKILGDLFYCVGPATLIISYMMEGHYIPNGISNLESNRVLHPPLSIIYLIGSKRYVYGDRLPCDSREMTFRNPCGLQP